MKSIVEKMLRFSRLERTTSLSQTQAVDLSCLLSDIVHEQEIKNERDIKISFDIADGIVIDGNPALLTSMINNLISNAYRYGNDGGNVAVSLKNAMIR